MKTQLEIGRLATLATCLAIAVTAHAQKKPSAPAAPAGQLIDASGRAVGSVLTVGASLRAIVEANGVVTSIVLQPLVTQGGIIDFMRLVPGNNDRVYFTNSNCSGTYYMLPDTGVPGTAPSVTLGNGSGSGAATGRRASAGAQPGRLCPFVLQPDDRPLAARGVGKRL